MAGSLPYFGMHSFHSSMKVVGFLAASASLPTLIGNSNLISLVHASFYPGYVWVDSIGKFLNFIEKLNIWIRPIYREKIIHRLPFFYPYNNHFQNILQITTEVDTFCFSLSNNVIFKLGNLYLLFFPL